MIDKNWVLCQTCYAMLPADPRAERLHSEWHDRIAQVAIENTKRIQELEVRAWRPLTR